MADAEAQHRAAFDGTVGPDLATVQLDDPGHGSQADPMAGEFVGLVKSFEGPEQFLAELGVEAGTVVAHEEHVFVRGTLRADL
jgi:hypothetical protein